MKTSQSKKQDFDELADLFLKKWKKSESQFVSYFEKQWLGAHRNWSVFNMKKNCKTEFIRIILFDCLGLI